jgi:mRNA-degrading endonuclease RelE of RelBE toxin-antitoxin system
MPEPRDGPGLADRMERGPAGIRGGADVAFTIRITRSALAEKATRDFERRRISEAIEQQLAHDPTTPKRNRKVLIGLEPDVEADPPIWELRVGDHRVFYDVDTAGNLVTVRAIREKPPHATTENLT